MRALILTLFVFMLLIALLTTFAHARGVSHGGSHSPRSGAHHSAWNSHPR